MILRPSLALFALSTLGPTFAAAEPAWRLRSDFEAPLNANSGWASELNEETVVQADQPFRLRLEWERTDAYLSGMPGAILQYRRNGDDDWIEIGAFDFPYPGGEEPRSPRVSAVRAPSYMHGEPTQDILPGSRLPFAGGTGANLAAAVPSWTEQTGHMELEWALVIRRWVDGAETNKSGDRFDFRLADATGRPLAKAPIATVTLEIPPGHVGGTFVETPGRIGPWQASNGDLYFIMEPAESSNLFMMIKSSDGGKSWREVDGENRPQADDLESVDGRLQGDTIQIAHQVTETLFRHAFRTSDHPTAPDTWAATDEVAARERSIAQATSLAIRSDGSMVAFYVGESLRYSLRSANGHWGPSHLIEPGRSPFLAGPQAVLGVNDEVHLAYFGGEGAIWYRKLAADNTLSAPVRIASGVGAEEDAFGSVLPLVFLPESKTVVIAYQLADLRLWERRIDSEGTLSAPAAVTIGPVVREAADSQQPGADLIAVGDTLYAIFIDDETRQIYTTRYQGKWTPAKRIVSNVRADWIRAMSHGSPHSGYTVRYIYDAGSGGGAGMNRYGQFPAAGE